VFETIAIVSTLFFAAVFIGLVMLDRSGRREEKDPDSRG
jgi:hypothetical protein